MQILINTDSTSSVLSGTFEQVLKCGLILRGKTKVDLAKFLGVSDQSITIYNHNGFPKISRLSIILEFLNAELVMTQEDKYIIYLKPDNN